MQKKPAALLFDTVHGTISRLVLDPDIARKMTSLVTLEIINTFSVKARRLNCPNPAKIELILKDIHADVPRSEVQAKYGLTKGQLSGIIWRANGN